MNQSDRIEAKLDRILELLDKKKVVRKPKLNIATSEFEKFWGMYPKKVGKKKCLSLWNNLFPNGVYLDLVTDVRNRLSNDQQWIDGYSPHPSTYLTQERWNDDIVQTVTPKVTMPRNDDELWPWAKEHGYPDPGILTYYQYRQKLERLHHET